MGLPLPCLGAEKLLVLGPSGALSHWEELGCPTRAGTKEGISPSISPLGLILPFSHPRAQSQPSCSRARRKNQAWESFEEHFCLGSISWAELCGSSAATLPHPAHTSATGSRLGHPALRQGLLQLCKMLGEREGFFSQGRVCCSFARSWERGIFLPKAPDLDRGGSRRWLCRGEMCRPRSAMGVPPAGAGLAVLWGLALYLFNPPTFLVSPPFPLCLETPTVGVPPPPHPSTCPPPRAFPWGSRTA